MNIVHINTRDIAGGAARAAYRLHQGLLREDCNSHILAGWRTSDDPYTSQISELVKGKQTAFDQFKDRWERRIEKRLGRPQTGYQSTKHILNTDLFKQADVINLHNLHGRYFNYHQLPYISRQKPVVWTLHDMWALTGHCAYAYDCQRWQTGCHHCPLLVEPGIQIVEPAPTRKDVTQQVCRTKRKLYQKSHIHVVAPSRWLYEQARTGILGNANSIQCIPYGIDTNVFKPVNRAAARQELNIPPKAKTILFVADRVSNGRKGFQYLLDALTKIDESESIILLTLGAKGMAAPGLNRFERRELGQLSDNRQINLAYNVADVFVFPTLADNLPLVLLEALAAGTPMVSFNVGGVPDLVRHMKTGYLARYKDSSDLANGIQCLLNNNELRTKISRRCRHVAEVEYALHIQARQYIKLYENVKEQYAQIS